MLILCLGYHSCCSKLNTASCSSIARVLAKDSGELRFLGGRVKTLANRTQLGRLWGLAGHGSEEAEENTRAQPSTAHGRSEEIGGGVCIGRLRPLVLSIIKQLIENPQPA